MGTFQCSHWHIVHIVRLKFHSFTFDQLSVLIGSVSISSFSKLDTSYLQFPVLFILLTRMYFGTLYQIGVSGFLVFHNLWSLHKQN